MRSKVVIVDFDDLCDNTVRELKHVIRLKREHPELLVTLFTIPTRCSQSTIDAAFEIDDMFTPRRWLRLAPHGWRHTRGECLSWTDDEAYDKICAARELGITERVFKAPGWLLDGDVYTACLRLDYAIASHVTFRVPHTNCREYVYNAIYPDYYSIHGHLTNTSDNYIERMPFKLPRKHSFRHVVDAAFVHTGIETCVP